MGIDYSVVSLTNPMSCNTENVRMDECRLITSVMYALDTYKNEIITELFGDSIHNSYRKEWEERTPFNFWCHLDSSNRAKVIVFAKKVYN